MTEAQSDDEERRPDGAADVGADQASATAEQQPPQDATNGGSLTEGTATADNAPANEPLADGALADTVASTTAAAETAAVATPARDSAAPIATPPPSTPHPTPGERRPWGSARSGKGAPVNADDGFRGVSAPPITVPAWKRRLFIDRPADLVAFVGETRDAKALAIDAEFITTPRRGPNDPSHRLTLLQFAFDNDYRTSYVVDTLRLADLAPLQEPLGRASLLKLFHGIGADTQVLATRGLVARHALDLEAVSRSLFGSRESGLQAMLLRACGERLDKSLQRADWARRPLTMAMVAYAARDAEMTYALYTWLAANYADHLARYVVPADEAPPEIAPWVLASLERGRAYPIEESVEDAGLTEDVAAQTVALRQALAAVSHPPQRARILRYITDLALTDLAPDLRPYLASPTGEERAGATRTLGRLRDRAAEPLIRPLLDDPVPDVRQAAALALENLASESPPRLPFRRALARAHATPDATADGGPITGAAGAAPTGATDRERRGDGRTGAHGPRPASSPRMWTSGPSDDEPPADDWRAALRARFAAPAATEANTPADPDAE